MMTTRPSLLGRSRTRSRAATTIAGQHQQDHKLTTPARNNNNNNAADRSMMSRRHRAAAATCCASASSKGAVAVGTAAAAAALAVVAPSPAHAAAAAAPVAAATAASSALLYLPPWTPLHVALLALASLNLLAGLSEGKGQNTPYSKFSPTQQKQQQNAAADKPAATTNNVLSSRDGMAIIYAGGLLVSVLAPLVLPGSFGLPQGGNIAASCLLTGPSCRPFLVALLLALHFLKREAEVFFLHRYSGGMPAGTAGMISAVYTATALQYLYFANVAAQAGFYSAAAAASSSSSAAAAAVGVALFVIGQAGNFYHHWLLAQLRRPRRPEEAGGGSKSAYAVPQGGLFTLVAAPHYLFEIVAWLGIALATQTVVPLVSCAGMASYLAGRSAATWAWNRANLPGYPRERRRLVPFLW